MGPRPAPAMPPRAMPPGGGAPPIQPSAAGMGVNAGHDLNRDNLTTFLRQVSGVSEVSIGHALIADALELGLDATVKDYLRCIDQAEQLPYVVG